MPLLPLDYSSGVPFMAIWAELGFMVCWKVCSCSMGPYPLGPNCCFFQNRVNFASFSPFDFAFPLLWFFGGLLTRQRPTTILGFFLGSFHLHVRSSCKGPFGMVLSIFGTLWTPKILLAISYNSTGWVPMLQWVISLGPLFASLVLLGFRPWSSFWVALNPLQWARSSIN